MFRRKRGSVVSLPLSTARVPLRFVLCPTSVVHRLSSLGHFVHAGSRGEVGGVADSRQRVGLGSPLKRWGFVPSSDGLLHDREGGVVGLLDLRRADHSLG